MFDQTFSYVLAIAALVIGVMLLTGHGSVFMKGRCFYRKHGSKDCICGYLICDPRSFSVSSQNKMSEKII